MTSSTETNVIFMKIFGEDVQIRSKRTQRLNDVVNGDRCNFHENVARKCSRKEVNKPPLSPLRVLFPQETTVPHYFQA